MLQNIEKIGYFALGCSLGVYVATKLYDREMSKPIGDIEEHVFEAAESVGRALEETKEAVEDILPDPDLERKREFNRIRRTSGNSKVDYASKFEIADTNVKKIANDILDNMANINIDEIAEPPADDVLPDVEKEDDVEYVRERVEEWIEVYLGENPQDPISLVYYAGDKTLCDDREQLITNPEDVVGTVALDRLENGGPGSESGVIFVRNLKTMIDYEVILDLGKYSETVLGIFEANLEKEDGGDAPIR